MAGVISGWKVKAARRRVGMAALLLTSALGLGVTSPALAQSSAQASQARTFNIPAGSLADALVAFGFQSGLQVAADGSLTASARSPGVSGSFVPLDALSRLLVGTGLTFRVTSTGAVQLERAPQASSGAIQLGPVRVEGDSGAEVANSLGPSGDPGSTEGTGSYTTRALTLGKIAQSIREIPQSVSVITRQRIEDQNLTTLDEALAQVTGVSATTGFVAGVNPSIYSRGFTIESFLRDGAPTERTGDFLTVPDLVAYDRVEVLRGAAGLFSGAGQPGGVVNLVRKRALRDTHIQVAAFAGSWNNYRAEADITGPLNASGTLRARAVGAYQDSDTFVRATGRRGYVLYGRLEYDLAPETTLSLGGHFEKRDNQHFGYGLPRYADGSDLHLPRSTNLSPAWNRWNFEKPEIFLELEHRWGRDWKAKVSAIRLYENSDQVNIGSLGAVDPATLLGPTIEVWAGGARRNSHQDALDVNVSGGFDAFGQRHEVVFGANFLKRYEKFREAYEPGEVYPVDVFDFDPYAYAKPAFPDSYSTIRETRVKQSGYYGALRLHPTDRLTVVAGGRLSQWDQTNRELLTGTVTQRNKISGQFTPYGGLVYDISRTFSLYASYADIFQVQNSYTRQGDLLPPIIGVNYEAGIKGEWFDGALNGSLALFRIEQTNRAQPDPTIPSGSPCPGSPTGTCSIAEGKVRSEGVEVELSGQLTPDLQIFAGYTYNTTRYLRDRTVSGAPSPDEGQPFHTITPEHTFRLWADYRLPVLDGRVRVGGGITAQSSWSVNYDVRIRQAGYALFNARASYEIDQNLTVSLNANNVFDKTYYAHLGQTSFANRYGEPRGVMLSLRGKF